MIRKYRRSRRYGRRYRRRYGKTYKIAKKAARRVIRSMAEYKTCDIAVDHAPGTSPWTIFELSSYIQEGTGNGKREGNKIRVKKIYGVTTLTMGDNTNHLRWMAVKPKGPFTLTAADFPNVLGFGSLDAPADTARLKILKDRHTYMDESTADQSFYNWRLPGGTWSYGSGTGPCDSPVYIGILSDSTALPHPAFKGYWRIVYQDF